MTDLIDRQALLRDIEEYHLSDGKFQHWVEVQPSVEAEQVVWCKDCKYWIPYDWMFSEVWKSQSIDDYAESEIGCAYCDMSMGAMDYCSRGIRKE